jgi:hypothetical protein
VCLAGVVAGFVNEDKLTVVLSTIGVLGVSALLYHSPGAHMIYASFRMLTCKVMHGDQMEVAEDESYVLCHKCERTWEAL